jgi:polyphosphate kinase 2 (PPK2 family)
MDHDFLWRAANASRDAEGSDIFNRSYYEEVLVVRVHPELLSEQHSPPCEMDESIWKRRLIEVI